MGQGNSTLGSGDATDMKAAAAFCTTYLDRQEAIVSQLKSICEIQRRAIEAMDNENDFSSEEKVAPVDDRDNALAAEMAGLLKSAEKASSRSERHVQIDDDEKNAPDVDFEDEGRGFTAVKPFLGAMAPPSDYKKDKSLDEKPKIELELEHVYGYRSRLCRNNLALVDENRCVYHAASVGIVYNKATNTQSFFRGHDDDILALAYHEEKRLVATGQSGKDPKICIWSVDDPSKALAVLDGCHKRGVVALAFSQDSERLVSIGLDDNHSVVVHKWKSSKKPEASSKGDTNRILHCAFNTCEGADGNSDFVTVGLKHIYFWSLKGGQLSKDRGLLGSMGEQQPLLSVNCIKDLTLVSTKTGHIYGFKGRKLVHAINVTSAQLNTVSADFKKDGTSIVATGDSDGTLIMWDGDSLSTKAPTKLITVDFNQHDSTKTGKNGVRATYMDCGKKNKVLVGTATGSIYEVDLCSKAVEKVTSGHFGDLSDSADYGECWGLAVHPTQKSAVSVAEDKTLRVWDITTRKQVQRVDLATEGAPRCCAYSPNGQYIAVGDLEGSISIVTTSDWKKTTSVRKAKKRVQCVQFSPDGTKLAAGTADNNVLFFDFENGELKHSATASGHSSVVVHLDWSKDGKWVQTDSQSYELLFYSPDGKQMTKSRDLKDVQWAEQTCTLGWNVQGIWPKGADGTDVNIVRRSHSEKFLATVEDSGLVKVFNYPCIGSGLDSKGKLSRRPDSVAGEGHSEHVTNVVWAPDDSYLVTAGGADNCLMQWKVKGAGKR